MDVEWIRKHMCPELPPLGTRQSPGPPARWNDTRIIIFTEYDDTKRYLEQQLSAAIASTDRALERIRIYHGPTPQAEREEIKRAFNADPRKHPDAKRFTDVDYIEVLNRGLKVMDSTAISLCMDNALPIIVFDLTADGNLQRVVMGEDVGTRVGMRRASV